MKKLLIIMVVAMLGVTFTACKNDEPKNQKTTGTENDHAWVDLGLSVKWATMNVGATSPKRYGNYYAWGETTTKSTYEDYNYKYCKYGDACYDYMTKYNTSSSYGTIDNKTTLEPADDAAHVNWGGSWRMPTDAEWTELRENCTWTWTMQNGVNGYKVTATNGNSIFLPAAGYRSGSDLYRAGTDGYYWSSSLDSGLPFCAWEVYFNSSLVYRYGTDRYDGQSVRPVCP